MQKERERRGGGGGGGGGDRQTDRDRETETDRQIETETDTERGTRTHNIYIICTRRVHNQLKQTRNRDLRRKKTDWKTWKVYCFDKITFLGLALNGSERPDFLRNP